MSQKLHDVLSGLMDDMKATEDTIDTAVTFISNLPHIVAVAVEHALGAAGADDETMASEIENARTTMQNHVQPLIAALQTAPSDTATGNDTATGADTTTDTTTGNDTVIGNVGGDTLAGGQASDTLTEGQGTQDPNAGNVQNDPANPSQTTTVTGSGGEEA